MLRKEQNDLLTQTGASTPMGRMFRAYWLPALLVDELPENDCPSARVKILSERLLAFRDSGFGQKIKLKSYRVVKRGPVLWTYVGPREKQPPLPEWEFAKVPAEQTF